MGEAYLDYKKVGSSGLDINGIIQDYYVYAGEKINAGDFVEFVNGIAEQTTETSNVESIGSKYVYTYACKIDENRVFAVEIGSDSPDFVGKILTFDNTAITVGEAYTIQTSLATYSESYVELKLLDKDKIIIAFSNYKTYAVICTISGSVITVGTVVTIGSGTSSYPDKCNQIGVIDSSTVLLCWNRYRNSTSSTYGIKAVILSISGTTITVNTINNIIAGYFQYLSLSLMSPTSAMLFFRDISLQSQGQSLVLTISGTTVTASSTKYAFLAGDLPNSYRLNSLPVNSTQTMLIYAYAGTHAVIATLSGTKISFGPATEIDSSYRELRMAHVSNKDLSKIAIVYKVSSNYYSRILSVLGNTITYGTAFLLPKSTSATKIAALYDGFLMNVEENMILAIQNYVTDSATGTKYEDLQLLGVQDMTISNNIIFIEYEPQVRPATAFPCAGVTKNSGEGGDSTEHKDIVSVYKPEIVNLVVNGDFETGDLTNWYNYQTTSSSGTISNTTKYSGEYSLEISFKTTNSGGADFVADANFQTAVVNNHIYYGSAFSKVSNINSAPAINVGGNYAEGARSLDWQQLSVRNTMNYNIFSLRIVGYSAGDKIWFDDVKVYDLTAMFGAGNEPTKEWCDANL